MQHLLGRLDVVEGTEVLAGGGHEVGLGGVLLGKARVLLLVGEDGRVGELLLKLLVDGNELLELVTHGNSLG